MEQIVDNISTYENFAPLSEAERNVLDKAIDIFNKNGIVPCTGCEYCMPCPWATPGKLDKSELPEGIKTWDCPEMDPMGAGTAKVMLKFETEEKRRAAA